MPDPVPEDVRDALRTTAGRRGQFGEPLVYFVETGSTNDVAVALAEAGARQGTTVVASAQTSGRGRFGREWFSPPGAGLYASVVCRDQEAIPFVSLAGGVAVAQGIRRATGLPVTIKWPNDVVVSDRLAPGGRRKLAGILAEGSSGPVGLQHVVLGFGINIRRADYPPAIVGRVTSLEVELGRAVESAQVLGETLAALNEQMTALKSRQAEAVLSAWRALSPSSRGAAVEWTVNGAARRGTTCGIDERGALIVRVGARTERIIAGELQWL